MGSLSLTTRIRIFERDGYACVYCGRRRPEVVLEVDHIVPRVSGGTNDSTNLVTACRQCNSGKRANPIGLPAGVVIQALPQLNHRMARRTRMGQSNHPEAVVQPARSVTAVIDAGQVGSLGSGSSVMGDADRRLTHAACDLCTYRADTVHFVRWVSDCQEVLFACGAHDPGGYWVLIETFDTGDYPTRKHILAKHNGWLALALLNERLNGRKPYAGVPVDWREAGGVEVIRRWA